MAIHIDVLANLNQRSVNQAAAQMASKFRDQTVNVKVNVDRGLDRAVAAMDRLTDSTSRTQNSIRDMGTSAFQTARGLGTLAIPIAGIVAIDFAKWATTASGALGMIPAVASAAAAGITTLQIATSGFSDTIKNVRDPEKFATSIQSLAPAAQQAALEIRNLLPEFDKLKNATQDAFFSGFAEQFRNLSNTFLPSIRNLTTSIATSMNQALSGVFKMLQMPENVGQIQDIFNNIGTMFRNMVPAAQSFSQAFLDITTVGSSFLPGMGQGISDIAASFANFIREARDSGKLAEWIQNGIDAVSMLATELWKIGEVIHDIFSEEGKAATEGFKDDLESIREVLAMMNGDFSGLTGELTSTFNHWGESLKLEMIGAINTVSEELNSWLDGLASIPLLGNLVTDKRIPIIQNQTLGGSGTFGSPGPSGWFPADQARRPVSGRPGAPAPAAPRGGVGSGGFGVGPGTAGLDPWSPGAVPAAPAGAGSTPSDRERLDAAMAGLAPSEFAVGGAPALTTGGATSGSMYSGGGSYGLPGGTNTGGYGTGTSATFPPWVMAIASQFGIKPSTYAGHQEDSRGEAGYAPNPQGLNRGIDWSGPVENMQRFADYLAANPGALEQVIWQNPSTGRSTEIAGGRAQPGYFSGDLAGHRDHVHTRQSQPIPLPGMGGGQYGAPGYQDIDPRGVLSAEQDVEQKKYDLEQARKERIAREKFNIGTAQDIEEARRKEFEAERDYNNSLLDLQEAQQGTWKKLGDSTRNTAKEMGQIGAEIDQDFGLSKGLPGLAENLTKFLANLAFAPTLGALSGVQAAGEQASGQKAGYGLFGALGAQNLAAGKSPLLGLNTGGMGALTAMATTGGATAPGMYGGSGVNWDALAGFEASGNWQTNTGNGFSGGLQFTPSSWAAAGGTQYAPSAHMATREQQIAAAENLLRMQGPGAWPAASSQHPEWFGNRQTYDQGGILPPGQTLAQNNTGAPELVTPLTGPHAGSGMPPGPAPLPGRGPGTGPTRIGGLAPPASINPGGAGLGIMPGGTIDMAIQAAMNAGVAAAGGAGMFGSGASSGAGAAVAAAAAQTAMKLANRAIQYGGQVAGIAASGLMETFLPTGGSELANNNWLTRIGGALAAAAPALPNLAGGALGAMQQEGAVNPITGQPSLMAPGALTPEQVAAAGGQHGMSGGAPPGPIVGELHYNNIGATEDRAGADLTHHLGQVAQAPMAGIGGPPR
jgi:hypothetical protein